MSLKFLIKISLASLRRHKGRSLLTMLGIIVGIAAIISTLAIGYGAEEKIKKEILASGDNYIFIHAGNWTTEGKTTNKKKRKHKHLMFSDIRALKEQCHEIKEISPFLSSRQIANFEGNNIITEIKGANSSIFKISKRKIKYGSIFNNTQTKKGRKVAVLGAAASKELFGYKNPVGQITNIKNTPFRIIGVLENNENYSGMQNPNLNIFIPFSSMKKYIHYKRNQKVYGIVIAGKSSETMPLLVRKIKKILRFRRKIKSGEPSDFMIYDQKSMLQAAHASSSVLNLFLLIIALISLIVGGIGVMNIMLVSVSERTKEIGIRMALGAENSIILKQFILESIILCFSVGIIVIFIGIATPYIVSAFTNWPVVIKPFFILLSFFTTTLVGIIFGYYPARQAAKLNPVEALQDK